MFVTSHWDTGTLPAGPAEAALTIFLPETVDAGKAGMLRARGARLVAHGQDCVEAEAAARAHAERSGSTYISPYNDRQVSCAARCHGARRSRRPACSRRWKRGACDGMLAMPPRHRRPRAGPACDGCLGRRGWSTGCASGQARPGRCGDVSAAAAGGGRPGHGRAGAARGPAAPGRDLCACRRRGPRLRHRRRGRWPHAPAVPCRRACAYAHVCPPFRAGLEPRACWQIAERLC